MNMLIVFIIVFMSVLSVSFIGQVVFILIRRKKQCKEISIQEEYNMNMKLVIKILLALGFSIIIAIICIIVLWVIIMLGVSEGR